jgi:GH24 family phage-related lysozyme (muramidase)
MNIEQAISYFSTHEGRVPYMYLDSVGLVTVGVGRMLSSMEDAQSLPFVTRGTNVPAGPATIGLEWQTIKQQEKDRIASYYEQFTMLDLPSSAIDAELAKDIEEFSAALRQRFPGFNLYPDSVQLGIIDMAYSMGAHELFRDYPKFCAAVDSQDWPVCAAECSREGVSTQRNSDCAALFKP